MIEDLFDDKPQPAPGVVQPLFPIVGHVGIPWAMWDRPAIDRLWAAHKVTTYSAAKLPLTAAQAVAVLADDVRTVRADQAPARLDQLVAEFRNRRGF